MLQDPIEAGPLVEGDMRRYWERGAKCEVPILQHDASKYEVVRKGKPPYRTDMVRFACGCKTKNRIWRRENAR